MSFRFAALCAFSASLCSFALLACSPAEPGPAAPLAGSAGTGVGGAPENGAGSGGAPPAPQGGTTPAPGEAGSGGGLAAGASGSAPITGGTAGTGSAGAPATNPCAPSLQGAIRFSVPSGTFQGSLSVEIEGPSGAELRYTTDGSAPSGSSTLYAGPIAVSQTTQLRAQPFSSGGPAGPSVTAVYVARSFDPTHDLPLIVLDSYGHGPLSRQDRSFVDVAFLAFGGTSTALSGMPEVASRAGFHIRGQSSSSFEKMPLRIELRDGTDADLDCPLLGMPSESDWVLIGPFPDKTLIHNAFVYGLGRDMGLAAPRLAFAELYVNVASRALEAGDYMGVYQVVETIKNQKNRLNLQQLEPTDTMLPALSGGYIFKFEWLASEEPRIACTGPQSTCFSDLEVVDPDPLAPEQQAYLTQHLQAFNDLIHSTGYADPTTGYAAYVDVPSFINQVIVHEVTRNMDAYVRSQYFHKDRDGKIFAGPLWDYDLTMNVGGAFDNLSIEGWQYEENAMRRTSQWFQRMLADPAFRAQLVTRWKELRATLLSEAQIDARIQALTAGLENAATRNFQRWNNLTQQRIGPFTTPTAATWAEQVQVMRTWLLQRIAWLDTQWQ